MDWSSISWTKVFTAFINWILIVLCLSSLAFSRYREGCRSDLESLLLLRCQVEFLQSQYAQEEDEVFSLVSDSLHCIVSSPMDSFQNIALLI